MDGAKWWIVSLVSIVCLNGEPIGALADEARPAADAPGLIFCCDAGNDLFCVLRSNNVPANRYDSPLEAIRQAPPGAGVLILADEYPAKPNTIDPAVLALAAEKEVRLYVEFPSALPLLDVGQPRATQWERGVVTSEAFGPRLPRMSLLGIHDCHFVPLEIADAKQGSTLKPHLVVARVAGFDTAVFGLPNDDVWPILVQHPRRDMLIATTKLSQFLTARYGPSDAWPLVWQMVLDWLRPNEGLAPLRWSPTVRPSYGPDLPMPSNFEQDALRRGTEWFFKAGMLSRTEDGRTVEDGSLGVKEGFASRIRSDGTQPVNEVRRFDCNGETAGALALAGAALDEPRYCQAAQNVADFLYEDSILTHGKRADNKHPTYGLCAWSYSAPDTFYPDDNARGLLGIVAAAGALDTDRWDERSLRCTLANLRLSGRFGFAPGSIRTETLEKDGWEQYFFSPRISPHPHYQCYIWACYLWAYHKTGCTLCRDRAKAAIRITMEAYPDSWRWTLGQMQIERARMLLPLAWLVRVEDTPEHRGWLRKMAEELLAHQVACGAIQERIPGEHRAESNAQYGTRETALIQNNGDPAADMLYTCNFAFLGLHEAAAATGDTFYAKAADRLAEFLCRIQVRSDAHPEFDGAWFRGFDYRRWDYWGVNGDIGWGAWCTETGWMQAWIVGTLAMRASDKSLWELAAKSHIEEHFETNFATIFPRRVLEANRQKRQPHAALGKPVSLSEPADPRYPGWGPATLTDGVFGDASLHGCLGFEGRDMEARVDLGKPIQVGTLAAEFRQSPDVGVFLPAEVEFALSDDGKQYRNVATLRPDVSPKEPGPLSHTMTTDALNVRARFVRVRARNLGTIPDWHRARGRKAWLFVGELLVNPGSGN